MSQNKQEGDSKNKNIRKVQVIIDPDTDVPECYSIYFAKKRNSNPKHKESSFLFKIVVEKKARQKNVNHNFMGSEKD